MQIVNLITICYFPFLAIFDLEIGGKSGVGSPWIVDYRLKIPLQLARMHRDCVPVIAACEEFGTIMNSTTICLDA